MQLLISLHSLQFVVKNAVWNDYISYTFVIFITEKSPPV